jgi:violaxanthin de-epoxidase
MRTTRSWKRTAQVGYGGAVVYTRQASVPPNYVPRIRDAFARANVDYGQFKGTDNSCRWG